MHRSNNDLEASLRRVGAAAALSLAALTTFAAQAAPAWGATHVLQSTFAVSSMPEAPLVAMNGAGETLYAWNAIGVVRTAERSASGAWGASRAVPGANTAAGPVAVALGRGGLAAVAWTTVATRYVPSQLLVSLRPVGGVFGAPVEIAPGAVAGSVRLGIDCAGSVTALWTDAYGVSAATLPGPAGAGGACSGTPGAGPWSAAAQVSTPHALASLAELAVNDAGTVLAAWQEGAAGNPTAIAAAMRHPGGAWQAPATVSAPTGRATWNPRPGLDAAGSAAVAYLDGSAMALARRPAGGSWQAPETVSGSQQVQYPALAVADSGDLLVAWLAIDPATGQTSVWQRQQTGGSWSAAARLSTRNEMPSWPSAALSGDGSLAIVTWTDDSSLAARCATLQAGVWTKQTLGPSAYWGGTIAAAAGGGKASTGWARFVNGNPNAAQFVGRGTQ